MIAPLCFIDTETTSLRPDRKAWEIAAIRREPGGTEDTIRVFVDYADLDMGNADPFSLSVGRFWERHPQGRAMRYMGGVFERGYNPHEWPNVPAEWVGPDCDDAVLSSMEAAHAVAAFTHGTHLVGAVPSFDAEVLGNLLREEGFMPAWHHHLIDVEALAVGFLAGTVTPPWKSDDLAKAIGVEPAADSERHTALGDARWAMSIYDRVMGVQR